MNCVYNNYCSMLKDEKVQGDAKKRTDIATRKEIFNASKHLKYFAKEGKTLTNSIIECIIEDAKNIFNVSKANDLRQYLVEIGLHNVFDITFTAHYYRAGLVYYLTKEDNLPPLPEWRVAQDADTVPEDISKIAVDVDSFVELPTKMIPIPLRGNYFRNGRMMLPENISKPVIPIKQYIKGLIRWTGKSRVEIRDEFTMVLTNEGEAGIRDWYNREKQAAFTRD